MFKHVYVRACALAAVFTLAACSQEANTAPQDGAEPEISEQPWSRVSYGTGYSLGNAVSSRLGEEIDVEALMAGLRDALEGNERRVSEADIELAGRVIGEQMEAERLEMAEASATAARDYLEANAARPEVTVTESGLQYEVLVEGEGASPARQDMVVTHYTGMLIDGTVFDSSVERGEPATFRLDQVIPGWTEALQLMQVGDKWKIYLPSELAYGERGAGADIPPNSALVFEVELIEINPDAEGWASPDSPPKGH